MKSNTKTNPGALLCGLGIIAVAVFGTLLGVSVVVVVVLILLLATAAGVFLAPTLKTRQSKRAK